jgi:hypothetical protein
MPTLAEIRQQFPQYSDLDDGALAEGLHRKYYSDIPREEFDKKIGFSDQGGGAFDTVKDVVKSGGIGVAQGAIGAVTFPGNIEQLGRAGINKVASLAGAKEPVVNPDTYLPNYNDLKGEIEEVTGEFYKPKTTPGEYARTGGEFASLAVGGPGGLASRAARVAVPAVASETAGQMTEGTALEPWARMAGALAGGRVANAGATTAQRAVTPLPSTPQQQAAVRTLENEGVTALTAGQRTGRKPLQWIESTLRDIPLANRGVERMVRDQENQFTRATLRRIGVNADRAEPHVMARAYQDIGNTFNQLAARNAITPSRHFNRRLQQIGDQYRAVTAEPMRVPLVEQTITALRSPNVLQNGQIPGRLFQNMRSDLSREANRLRASDPPAGRAVSEIMDTLDNAMEASIRLNNRADLGAWRNVRRQYRNYLAIEDAATRAGSSAAEGIITPSALRSAVARQGKRAYSHGRGDLTPLARAGELVMKPLPQSGTTPRAIAAGLLGGTGLANPMAALAPIATGNLLMSGPVQRYFANQAAGGVIPAVPQASALQRGIFSLPGAMDAGLFGDQ